MEQEPLPPQADEVKYTDLLKWLKDTKVLVREDFVGDSQQPIRNLFINLGLFYALIRQFITLRKLEGIGICQETLYSMHSIIAEMSNMYGNAPRKISSKYPDHSKGVIIVGSPEYKSFFKTSWEPMIHGMKEQYEKNEFLTSLLTMFGGIWFDSHTLKTLENFETLFSEIFKMNDPLVNQLYETYCLDGLKYYRWYMTSDVARGGRKLTRRRKSNPKSKSKRKYKQRSYKKSSYRRQRH
jgi:hypothetical protein